jgi:GR25 family glycosyltransferase involved in LPS biosynthesis
LGISGMPVRFPAVHFRGVPDNQRKLAGQAGCTLSHFAVLADAKKDNLKNFLVLEDDFEIYGDKVLYLENLSKSISQLPANWDMFYLGGNLTDNYGVYPVSKYSENLLKLHSCHTTHAFAVNASCYGQYSNNAPNPSTIFQWMASNTIIDVFLSRYILNKCNAFIADPMLTLQAPGLSDIEQTSYDYRRWMLDNFSSFKKRLQNA